MHLRVYTVVFDAVAVTAAQELFAITPADDKPVVLLAAYITQSTELGDAAEEQLRVNIIRGHTVAGAGGTAPTPQLADPHAGAAGFTARVNDTTIASAGTPVTLHTEAFNVRAGMAYIPTPEMQLECTQAQGIIVVRLMAAPADAVTMHGTLYVGET